MPQTSSFLLVAIVGDIVCTAAAAVVTNASLVLVLVAVLVRCFSVYLFLGALLLLFKKVFNKLSIAPYAVACLAGYLFIPLLIYLLKPGKLTLPELTWQTHIVPGLFSFIYLPYILGVSASLVALYVQNRSEQVAGRV